MSTFKPMLACSKVPHLEHINYPVIAMPKYDGIRCVIKNGEALSRRLKPIPNEKIAQWLAKCGLSEVDGELMAYNVDTGAMVDFNDLQSLVMTKNVCPFLLRKFNFIYYIFDVVCDKIRAYTYAKRILYINAHVKNNVIHRSSFDPCVSPHVTINNATQLLEYHEDLVKKGYEGTIVRCPNAKYKYGRSTLKEGGMLKIKDFSDAEAKVFGFHELMVNHNEQTKDVMGNSVRSSHGANKIPGNTLGALNCILDDGTTFDLGTGFDDALRAEIWNNPRKYIGAKVTFKYQGFGPNSKPRFPVFKGFRYDV